MAGPKTKPKKKVSKKQFSFGVKFLKNWYTQAKNLKARRPHKSFRLTKRRDYVKELKIPGYWSFTFEVFRVLRKNFKMFLLLALVYSVLTGVMVGMASQETYSALTDTLQDTGQEVLAGDLGKVGEAGLLFLTIISGDLSNQLTEGQQIYSVLIGLLAWLSVVWLLRNLLAGNKVRLRDGLYNAGAPILSTFLVSLTILVQLLPLALAMIGYAAAVSSGLLSSGGVEAMLFWLAAGLLAALSVYWVTGTFMALVIVTLPGMYPWHALQVAGDLVLGRRVRVLLRLVWLLGTVAVSWLVVMIPLIIIDSWIKGLWTEIEWLPVIPAAVLAMSSLTIVWSSSYVYLLYRRIVDNDSE